MGLTALKGKKLKKKTIRSKARTGLAGVPIEKGFDFVKNYFHLEVDKKDCISQVKAWIKKNLVAFPPKQVIITYDKAKYAKQADGTPNILIDDYGTNIDKWQSAGGVGFKHKDHKFERTAQNIKQNFSAYKEDIDEILGFATKTPKRYTVKKRPPEKLDKNLNQKVKDRLHKIRQDAKTSEAAGVGIITKQNTTVDVKPGETKRQAAKMGFKLDKKGYPPSLRK